MLLSPASSCLCTQVELSEDERVTAKIIEGRDREKKMAEVSGNLPSIMASRTNCTARPGLPVVQPLLPAKFF